MAIGFNPNYTELLPINNLTPHQFLALALEISESLLWTTGALGEDYLTTYTNNGQFVHNAEISILIEDGTAYLKSASAGNEMIDMGKNKKNIDAFIARYYELRPAVSLESLSDKYQAAVVRQLEPKTTIEQNENEISQNFHISNIFSFFVPRKGYIITPIIIYLNIVIFIIMILSGVDFMDPDVESLINWGGNTRELSLHGEWWRLISCVFLHAGIVHLVFNMFALAYIGMHLEPKLGKFNFGASYLIAGVAASAASAWHSGFIVSVGASGAIFGMYGIFLALLTTNFIEKEVRKALFSSIAIFIAYNLLGGLNGSIDNAAHLGGVLSGIAMGYLLIPSLKKPQNIPFKVGTIAIFSVLVLLMTLVFSKTTTDDTKIYEAKMAEFLEMEPLALSVYNHLQYGNKAEILDELQNRSTYYWMENLKITNEIEALSLPSETKKRNLLVKMYCEQRIRFNKILYKAISEETSHYEAQLQQVNREIETLTKRIN